MKVHRMKFQLFYKSDLDPDNTLQKLNDSPLTHGSVSEGDWEGRERGYGVIDASVKEFKAKFRISRYGKVETSSFSDPKDKERIMQILKPHLIKKDWSPATLTLDKISVTVECADGLPPKNFKFPACSESFLYELVAISDTDELALVEKALRLSGLPENKGLLNFPSPLLDVPNHIKQLLEQARRERRPNNAPIRV